MKKLIALLIAAASVTATVDVASAGTPVAGVTMIEGPAFGPADIQSAEGPGFGPTDVQRFDGPGFGPADVRSFDGPANGWINGGNQR